MSWARYVLPPALTAASIDQLVVPTVQVSSSRPIRVFCPRFTSFVTSESGRFEEEPFTVTEAAIDCGLMSFLLSFRRKIETAYRSPWTGLVGSTS